MLVQKSFGRLHCQSVSAAGGEVLFYPSIPYAVGRRLARSRPFEAGSTSEVVNRPETLCFPQRSLPTKLNIFLQHHMLRDEWSVKGDIQSEDALVVNIWVRPEAEQDPVLVFVHGSGDCNSGTTPIYNGANLASRGVVVVTITYRIGNFGYLPVFDGPKLIANLAYYDQQTALRWIRTHIAEFGGDKGNITLAGHSGGALAANHHYLNEISSQYFDKCMFWGGPMPRVRFRPGLEEEYRQMLRANHCRSLEALRALPARRMVRLKKARRCEVLDGDFFRVPSEEALRAQQFSPKPILIGSNADEFSMIELPMYYKPMGITTKAGNLDEVLAAHYGIYAPRLKAAFGPEAENPADLQIKILEALVFHYSVLQLMQIYAQKSPVYGYRLHYVPHLYGGRRGAYHGAEVALFFDNLDKMKIKISEENRRQSRKLQEDWLAFLQYGQIPAADTYNRSGQIISYRGTTAYMSDFPHAALLNEIGESQLPAMMMENFLAGR